MSSDFVSKLGRRAAIGIIIGSAALLSSCQVRPLYSETSGVTAKISSVGFSDATSRIGQEVRNRLIFIAGRGAGEAQNPEYKADLSVRSSVTSTLLVQASDNSRAGRVTVSVDYTLRSTKDNQVIKAGNRYATALVDFPRQQFAKLRAIRDAENRAAREAAEFVSLDIAAALGR